MKSSKNIERLFQEGLKDFQASPSPKVWDGVEQHLYSHQKKRMLPVWWWRAASVAAILAIFSSIGVFYYQTSKESSLVVKDKTETFKPASAPLEVIPTQFRFSSVTDNLFTLNKAIQSKLAFQIPKFSNVNAYENVLEKKSTSAQRTAALEIIRLEHSGVAMQQMPFFTTTLLTAEKEKLPFRLQKKSLFDAIEEDQQVVEIEDASIDKPWEVRPNVAPVFMNSLTGGNPLESSLEGQTSSNPNVSYGVNVAYAINKKLKVRTGVNQVAMGYNTQDVILSTASSSFRTQASSNPNLKTDLVADVNILNARSQAMATSEMMGSAVSSSTSFSSIGVLNHELGFLEVPLEVEYAIVDKKIGLHVLGGASTYVLNNNEIFFEERGNTSSIGEAQNLNAFSFSANFGVGVDYNFSKTFSFNLEPKFLYQINTFQDNASNFQPYFFGIYSGLTFKF